MWIFYDLWWICDPSLESMLDDFLIFYAIWIVKKRTWITGMFFDDFLTERVQFSDVPTLQKHSKYNGFHDISLFQLFHCFEGFWHLFGPHF